MPCRDYESDTWDYSSENRKLKAQADKLARIACKAMSALEELEKEDFLLLKDDEVREWWQKHKEADRKEKARVAEKERRARVKAEALARLSDEEKELLGLASPKKKLGSKQVHAEPEVYEYDEDYTEWSKEEDELNEMIEDLHTIAGTIAKTYRVK
jgi:hypothetical protein